MPVQHYNDHLACFGGEVNLVDIYPLSLLGKNVDLSHCQQLQVKLSGQIVFYGMSARTFVSVHRLCLSVVLELLSCP